MASSEIDAAPQTEKRQSKDYPLAFRLVLVGKTGAGKSASGNTILGREAFCSAVSHSSVSRQCCKQTGQVASWDLTVVDTPGLFDTSLAEAAVQREVSKCINMSAPGPHAILLVIKVGPFTQEERDAVRQVEEIFGPDAWRFTILLFVHDQGGGAELERQLREAEPELRQVLEKAGNRFHFLNNERANEREQVLQLLRKVEDVVFSNGGEHYSNLTYVEVMEMLRVREAELKEFYRKKLEQEVRAVEEKYEEKLRGAQDGGLKRRREEEVKEVQRYYTSLLNSTRHVVEQTMKSDALEDVCAYHMTLRVKVAL